jgi:subtilisin-like proprotein convertase family protein
VPIDIDHPNVIDVVLDLTSPSGTTVELEAAGQGGFNAFEDGTYGVDKNPTGDLSNFNGENPSGTWTIKADDDFPGFGSGTLNSWGVTVSCQ